MVVKNYVYLKSCLPPWQIISDVSAISRVYGSKPLCWRSMTIITFKRDSSSLLKDFLAPKQQIINQIQQKSVCRHPFSNLLLRALAYSKVGENPGNEGALAASANKKMCLMSFLERWH